MQNFHGFDMEHWFITDNRLVIELSEEGVVVREALYDNSTREILEEAFWDTDETSRRIRAVCGTTNFSLAFRNSEHLANYIMSGSWISYQMAPSGSLYKELRHHLRSNRSFFGLLHELPQNLKPNFRRQNTFYPEHSTFSPPQVDQQSLQTGHQTKILVVGPSGSGKSTIINQLFQKPVSEVYSGVSLRSPEVKEIPGFSKSTDVTVFDTVNFGNAPLQQNTMKMELLNTRPDKVLVVLSGRIQKSHADAIKQILDMFNYTTHRQDFVFLYNKTEYLSEEEKEKTLYNMCRMLKVEYNKNVRAVAFPPGADYSLLEDHLQYLRKVLFGHL